MSTPYLGKDIVSYLINRVTVMIKYTACLSATLPTLIFGIRLEIKDVPFLRS